MLYYTVWFVVSCIALFSCLTPRPGGSEMTLDELKICVRKATDRIEHLRGFL
jgi:hypothetical protein